MAVIESTVGTRQVGDVYFRAVLTISDVYVVTRDGLSIGDTTGRTIVYYREKDVIAAMNYFADTERSKSLVHVVNYAPRTVSFGDIYSKRKTDPYTGAPDIPVKKKERWWKRRTTHPGPW